MLLMNGYLRKAQHDENNLNIEVTVEVISDFKVKKASVFNGFKRQTTKNTASRLPVARLSSASVKKLLLSPENFGFPGVFFLIDQEIRSRHVGASQETQHYIPRIGRVLDPTIGAALRLQVRLRLQQISKIITWGAKSQTEPVTSN